MTALDEYRELWLQLDALNAEQFESPEADAIRDRMDGPWRRMTKAELEGFREWVKAREVKS